LNGISEKLSCILGFFRWVPEIKPDLRTVPTTHKFVESVVSDSSQADYRGAMLT